ncbi:MAG TPA: sulfate adenylyltransferase, partial [Gammaproteobacteria bacterium]|nr:sulfate adenylyltransferase [Gammaproteobacteria bacterium]
MLLVLIASQVPAKQAIKVDQQTLDKVEKKYGSEAITRIETWQQLVSTDESKDDLEKLKKVNDFFNNNTQFINDIDHWH